MPYLIEPDTHVDVTFQTEPWSPPTCESPTHESDAPPSRLLIVPGETALFICDDCAGRSADELVIHLD